MDKRKWTEEQRHVLLEMVRCVRKPCGSVDWDVVARSLPFTSKQCQVQFNNLRRRDASVRGDEELNQRRNHQWTRAEESKLLSLARQHQKNWEAIAQIGFPDLTPQKIKNKYATLLRHDDSRCADLGQNELRGSDLGLNGAYAVKRKAGQKGEQIGVQNSEPNDYQQEEQNSAQINLQSNIMLQEAMGSARSACNSARGASNTAGQSFVSFQASTMPPAAYINQNTAFGLPALQQAERQQANPQQLGGPASGRKMTLAELQAAFPRPPSSGDAGLGPSDQLSLSDQLAQATQAAELSQAAQAGASGLEGSRGVLQKANLGRAPTPQLPVPPISFLDLQKHEYEESNQKLALKSADAAAALDNDDEEQKSAREIARQLESQLDQQLSGQLHPQLSAQITAQLNAQLEAQLECQLGSQLEKQMHGLGRVQSGQNANSSHGAHAYGQIHSQSHPNSQSHPQPQPQPYLPEQLNDQLALQLNVQTGAHSDAPAIGFNPGGVDLQNVNLLRDISEMSVIDSARLFILDSARQ